MKRKYLLLKKSMALGVIAGLVSILCLCMLVCIVKEKLDEAGRRQILAQERLAGVLEDIKSKDDTSFKYKAEYYAKVNDFLLEDGSRTSLEFTSNNLIFWLNGGSCDMKFSGENVVRYSAESRDIYNYTCYFVPRKESIVKYTRRYNVRSDDVYRTWNWDMETCSNRSTHELFSYVADGKWKSGQERMGNVDFLTFSCKIPNIFGGYPEYDFCRDVKELELMLYLRKSDDMLCMIDIMLPDGKTKETITYCGQTCNIQDFRFRFSLYDKDDAFQIEDDISGVNLGMDGK